MHDHKDAIKSYETASRRIFFLDYDGVLMPIMKHPDLAKPSVRLKNLLSKLSADPKNTIVIVTGRSHENIGAWLGDLPIDLSAEHGSFTMESGESWHCTIDSSIDWKSKVQPVLQETIEDLPGAFMEHKTTSLVLHYRNADRLSAETAIPKLKTLLQEMLSDYMVVVQDGKMLLDIHSSLVNKGTSINQWINTVPPYDFIMIAGDDVTDEDMFNVAPKNAFSYHVGNAKTAANHCVDKSTDIIALLSVFAES